MLLNDKFRIRILIMQASQDEADEFSGVEKHGDGEYSKLLAILRKLLARFLCRSSAKYELRIRQPNFALM